MDQLYQITTPHFVAGFCYDTNDQVVFKSAPIIKYLNRWRIEQIAEYCQQKNWLLNLVSEKGELKWL